MNSNLFNELVASTENHPTSTAQTGFPKINSSGFQQQPQYQHPAPPYQQYTGSSVNQSQQQPQPSGFSSAPPNPVSTPFVAAPASAGSVWDKMISSSGPKTGNQFVVALQAAINLSLLSSEQVIVLVRNFKSLPLGTPEEIEQVFQSNKALSIATGAKISSDYSVEATRPWIEKTTDLVVFKVAVSAIRSKLTNLKALKWGTLAQCTPFRDLKMNVLNDSKKTMPKIRGMLMRRFLYNVCDYTELARMVVLRWKALFFCIRTADKCGWTFVPAGTNVNGFTVITPYFKAIDLSQLGQASKLALGSSIGEALMERSDEFWYNLSVAAAIDVTHLLQCVDVRRGGANQQFKGARSEGIRGVVIMMLEIISHVEPDFAKDFTGPATLLKNGPFFRKYQDCRNILGATLRNMIGDIFGRNAGALTRTFEGDVQQLSSPSESHFFPSQKQTSDTA